MHRCNMAVTTTAGAVALLMAWVVPSIIDDLRKVCINSGMLEDLTTLSGIGPITAEKIIDHRQKNGPFQTPEDLMKVKGFGEKLYQINQEDIVIDII